MRCRRPADALSPVQGCERGQDVPESHEGPFPLFPEVCGVRAKKVDKSHAGIRDALRAAGIRVHDTSAVGLGYPDLHCSYRGYTALVECKTPGEGGIRGDDRGKAQRDFHAEWEGPLIIATTPLDAIKQFMDGYSDFARRKY